MSMIGEYARVTPDELRRIVSDPQWALEFVEELVEAELDELVEPYEARCLDTDKAWDALGFLLRRVDFPVDLARGEEDIPGAEDWGYGTPRYVTAERVRVAADALAGLSGARLIDGVEPDELARAGVYPSIVWERGESLGWVRDHYEWLVPFVAAAAEEGHALLVWLD